MISANTNRKKLESKYMVQFGVVKKIMIKKCFVKKLSKGEFFQFNVKSQTQLIGGDGIFLFEKRISETYVVKIFMVYTFYVVVFFNNKHNKVEKVEPVPSRQWLMNLFIDSGLQNDWAASFSKN